MNREQRNSTEKGWKAVLRRSLKVFVVAVALNPRPLEAIQVCSFESFPDTAGRDYVAGTITRTSGGVLIEYTSHKRVNAMTCASNSCVMFRNGVKTTADLSYNGFMVTVSEAPSLDMTIVGLARVFGCVGSF